jgi:predicted lysophospholipase L1 biosynthesis ABC-type transport system permease subunit
VARIPLKSAAMTVAVGLVFGLGVAELANSALKSLILEVPALDPWTIASTILLFLTTALVGSAPAIRLARHAPIVSLEDGMILSVR